MEPPHIPMVWFDCDIYHVLTGHLTHLAASCAISCDNSGVVSDQYLTTGTYADAMLLDQKLLVCEWVWLVSLPRTGCAPRTGLACSIAL